jgi:glyoxylase-like metal-dependent hydrolase (beta-lactamase superfamily II)
MRPLVAAALVACGALLTALSGQTPPGSPQFGQPQAHRFVKVTDSVFLAIPTSRGIVNSNSAVVINDQDVLIVDSHVTPLQAQILLDDIRTLTPKPVRTVVNSHYHFDHAHGNQVFASDVQIIGHEFTRRMLLSNVFEQRTYRRYTDAVPTRLESLRQQLTAATDVEKRLEIARQLAAQEAYLAGIRQVKPTPPNVVFSRDLTLYKGTREFQIRFLGRGHTGGDIVVFLPRERIVLTGDLMEDTLSYMGDGYVDEWIVTLDNLMKLDFDTVLTGHGDVFTGKTKIQQFQAYLKDAWSQAERLKTQGVAAPDAAKRIDLTPHKAAWPSIQGPGLDPAVVARMYDRMDGKDEF